VDLEADRVRKKALQRAAEILGGSRPLRAYLNVSAIVLATWLSGAAPPPTDVFLKVVDLIVEKDLDALRRH
jgi:hypothetical protein